MARQRDIFGNFERMRREMDELFGEALSHAIHPRRRAGFSPAVDVYYAEEPRRAVVRVELAGIDADSLSLEVSGRELVISGLRRAGPAEGRVYQQVEIEHGPFRRVVSLGADVRPDDARASYEDGVLQVELPLAAPQGHVRTVPVRTRAEDGS